MMMPPRFFEAYAGSGSLRLPFPPDIAGLLRPYRCTGTYGTASGGLSGALRPMEGPESWAKETGAARGLPFLPNFSISLVSRWFLPGSLASFSAQNGSGVITVPGRPVAWTDANGNVTRFEYDAWGRQVAEVYPDGSPEETRYDAAGRVIEAIDRAGRSITFRYDPGGRLIERKGPGIGTESYEYDAANRLVRVVDARGRHEFTYDAVGRVVRARQPNGFVVGYAYDAAGNRTRLEYPGGRVIEYGYDARNRVVRIVDGTDEYSFGYDAASRRTRLEFPNGFAAKYSYDAANRLTGLVYENVRGGGGGAGGGGGGRGAGAGGVGVGAGGGTESLGYTYDAVGNILTREDVAGTHRYGYDAAYQITSADYPARYAYADQTFVYDPAGNRTAFTEGPATTAYTVNELNQYTRVDV
ncbi:MAG: RHS repeat protein [Candidatus Hydrogenedentota bacterium]|nr:MAG: RHS repeat protein [Candidatus Hydrogenedentota bacterium]